MQQAAPQGMTMTRLLRSVLALQHRGNGGTGLLFFLLLASGPHHAQSMTDAPCSRAIGHAAAMAHVPAEVLSAMALVESGRTVGGVFVPWPWTTNESGTARHFATRQEAEAHLRTRLEAGVRNIDVGCLQINYHWHEHAFPTPEVMLDPFENAVYAATYLSKLYRQSNDWAAAIGAYHSRNPDRARLYAQKVLDLIAVPTSLPPDEHSETPAVARSNQQERPVHVGRIIRSARGQLVDLDRRSIGLLPIRKN